jgi:hypothetical protein
LLWSNDHSLMGKMPYFSIGCVRIALNRDYPSSPAEPS